MNIRLIIASSVRMIREALATTLRGREGLTVVDAVNLRPQGIERIADGKPDVVLIDLGQTDAVSAAKAIKLIKSANPGIKLVAFGLDEIDDRAFACVAAGFSGYLSSESGADELHRALLDAMEGRIPCAPHIVAPMFERLASLLHERDRRGTLPFLTSRESEILGLVAQGSSNKEVARELAISSATVKNHMHNILQKLRVTRRGQAVARLRGYRGR